MSVANLQAWAFIGALFAIGAVVIGLFAPATAGKGGSAELWAYFRSEFAIVAGVMLPATVHPWLMVPVAAVAAMRMLWELRGASRQRRSPSPGVDGLALLTVALCCAAVGALSLRPDGVAWVVFMFICTEMQDSMAFLLGRLFGRRRIFPVLSPNKTWAGTLGGLTLGVAAGAAFAWLVLGLSPGTAVLAALVCNAAGLGGDLLASAYKRDVGIKDYPPIHRLHGGLLDIYDSLIFTAPWALALAVLITARP